EYVSLIMRRDSAAMVAKTSELLPDPETPVNTVSRRFGRSMLISRRLFSRAPRTRIRSCESAGWGARVSSSVGVVTSNHTPPPASTTPGKPCEMDFMAKELDSLTRKPERGSSDRGLLDALLDDEFVGTLATVTGDGDPWAV